MFSMGQVRQVVPVNHDRLVLPAGHTQPVQRCAADRGRTVKIATFNINNINKRLENLVAWLA
jgi:hypothetical protein